MTLFASDVCTADFQPTDTELSFLQRIQVRRMHAYARIAEAIMFLATPAALLTYAEPSNKYLSAAFISSAFVSLCIRQLFVYQNWLPRYANQATFLVSTLYLLPATLSTILRPENESGRALVLVGLATSSFCFSLRWFAANQVVLVLFSLLAWHQSGFSFGVDDALILMISVPAVGSIICSSQISSLQRAFRFQKESSDRQQELETALKQLMDETELRRDEEQRRAESEQRLKEQQQQLLHVCRLTTMGELVASIAHELHQPMHATSMYAGVLDALTAQDATPLSQKVRDHAGKIVTLTQQSATTVRRLQNFVRRGPRVRALSDLAEIIQDALELTATETRHLNVQVEVQLAHAGYEVEVDPVQIQQVLINLFRNSCEAMHNTPLGERKINIQTRATEDQIELCVSDSGCGLSISGTSKIFDTFYSTNSNGLGMGLAISRSIMEDHCGSIEVISEPDQGATFRLLMPAVRTDAKACA